MIDQPRRIQLTRRKCWKIPPNTVVVSRPSRWGNPFFLGHTHGGPDFSHGGVRCAGGIVTAPTLAWSRVEIVAMHAAWITGAPIPWPAGIVPHFGRSGSGFEMPTPPTIAEIIAELAGKNLACWCPLDQPCHADVLLEMANQPITGGAP